MASAHALLTLNKISKQFAKFLNEKFQMYSADEDGVRVGSISYFKTNFLRQKNLKTQRYTIHIFLWYTIYNKS